MATTAGLGEESRLRRDAHGADERQAHVHRDGLDPRQVVEREAPEAAKDALARALRSHADDVPVVEVAGNRRVDLAPGDRLLVQADDPRRLATTRWRSSLRAAATAWAAAALRRRSGRAPRTDVSHHDSTNPSTRVAVTIGCSSATAWPASAMISNVAFGIAAASARGASMPSNVSLAPASTSVGAWMLRSWRCASWRTPASACFRRATRDAGSARTRSWMRRASSGWAGRKAPEKIRSTRAGATSSPRRKKQAAMARSRRKPARVSESPRAGADAMHSFAMRDGARIPSHVAVMPPRDTP